MTWARGTRLGSAALVGLAAPWLVAATLGEQPPPIAIRVGSATRYAVANARLGEFAAQEGLRPAAGDLVSVRGRVLEAGRYPGRLELDGHPAGPGTILRSGDRVRAVNGADHMEPVRTTRARSPHGEPPSPEYILVRAPGVNVTSTGTLSGEVARTAFEPTGRVRRPRAVALTFDDGPWPGSTRAILRILQRRRAPATFFLIGEQVRRYPNLVRAELRAGMEVGDHSWDHPFDPPLAHLATARIHDELSFTKTAETQLGASVTVFRPPGGSWSGRVVALAHAQAMRVVLWSVDPRDWAPGATAKGIVRNVLTNVRAGSIVLLHDGGGDRAATVRALPRIIAGIRKRGLRLVPIER